MGTVANDPLTRQRNLPARIAAATTLRDALALPSFTRAEVVAGAAGLDRELRSANVMEVPDILPWVKAHELLLTTGFPLRHAADPSAEGLCRLIAGLAAREVAALAIKTGRYLDEVPADLLRAADAESLPLILLPADLAFDEVLGEVFTLLVDRQASALDAADRLHRALSAIVLEGGSIVQVAEEIAALVGAAVLVCSLDGRVQTVAGAPAQRQALLGSALFEPAGRFLVERVAPGVQPAPDGGELAVSPIVAGGTGHGWICALFADSAPPGTVQALERAAIVAALAVTKQLAISAVESKFRGDFLRDVLTGTAGAPWQVLEHFRALGWDVDRPLVVAVARLDEPAAAPQPGSIAGRAPLDRLASAWEQVVRVRDKAAPVVGFGLEVVALLAANPQTAQTVVGEVVAAVAGDRGGGRRSFSVGVSRVVDTVADLPRAYDQARKAVAVGRRTQGSGAVAHFDSLGVHRVLSLVEDSDELRAFATETLHALAADTAEAADLRHTLEVLLDSNCNVAEAARSLHFHYNTLRYRIGKLEGIVGPFTQSGTLRLDLALALRIVGMRGL